MTSRHRPPRAVSAPRTVLVAALSAGLLASCGTAEPQRHEPWLGGYVNATAWPPYDLPVEAGGEPRTVLGFVVADEEDPCTPSWGGYYSLDEAGHELRLDSAVAQYRQDGGEVAVSFGGAARDEPATVCTDVDRLVESYRTVVDRYRADAVDLDVEMDDLGRRDANERRAEALARLQEDREEPLEVWLTLPVGPQGLEEDATEVVAQTLEGGVDLTGVNLMTMNYGPGAVEEDGMVGASVRSLRAAHGQLVRLWEEAGQPLSEELVWNRMGATPMIGRNDMPGQVLRPEGAAELARFARDQGLGRFSYWSLNRDRSCTDLPPDVEPAADLCSGIRQDEGEFADRIRTAFTG